MKKTVLSIYLILVFLIVGSIDGFALEEESLRFIDVTESAWYTRYVSKLITTGSIRGYEDGTFKPEKIITKAEFVTLVLNALGVKQEAAADDHWAMNYIREAESLGILDINEFKIEVLNHEINRFEATKILIRAFDEEIQKELDDIIMYIKDYDTIPIGYVEYVLRGYGTGLISGYPDGEFKGFEVLTRAEASVMVTKMIDKGERSNIEDMIKAAQEALRIQEEQRKSIVSTALQFIGVPYLWGGTTPSGFDSSGFIWYVFRENGINIPRISTDIFKFGKQITREELQPGDLVFFEGYKPGPSHGSIYIGNDQFIHSPTTGKTVSISSLNDPYYWGPKQYGWVRIIE